MSNFENHPLFPGEGVPLFISAGPLKEAVDFVPFMGLDDPLVVPILTNGGWTLTEWPGNATSKDPDDFVYYPDLKMAGNTRGLPCSGIEGLKKLKEPIKILSDKGIKTIIQVTNLPHENPLEVIPILTEVAAELNPTAVEANLSCPNGLDENDNLHPPVCDNIDVSAAVISASRDRVGDEICFGAKDSPHATSLEIGINVEAIQGLARVLSPYIDFLTGINTIGEQAFPEIVCAGGKGGMSGPIVAPIARAWLKAAREALDDNIPILSCGGIDSSNAATEIPLRKELGAMLFGGAQEFFRKPNPEQTALRWAEAYAEAIF